MVVLLQQADFLRFLILAAVSFVTPFIFRWRKTRSASALAEEESRTEEEEL